MQYDCIVRIIENPNGLTVMRPTDLQHRTPENEVTIKELAHKMVEIFDKHFRREGDPHPEIKDVSSEDFYGKGYEDCDHRIPDVDKGRTLLDWNSSMISTPCSSTR